MFLRIEMLHYFVIRIILFTDNLFLTDDTFNAIIIGLNHLIN